MPVQVDTWGPSSSSTRIHAARGASRRAAWIRPPRPGLGYLSSSFDFASTSEDEVNWEGVLRELPRALPLPRSPIRPSRSCRCSVDGYLLEQEPSTFSTSRPRARAVERSSSSARWIERGQFHFLWPTSQSTLASNLSIGPVVALATERTGRFLDYFVGPNVDVEFDNQVARRTPSSSSGCRRDSAAAASRTARPPSSSSACSRIFRIRWSPRSPRLLPGIPLQRSPAACLEHGHDAASRKTSASRLLIS